MNYTNYIKIFLKGITVCVAMFFFGVSFASEPPRLVVVFNPSPLFNQLNFLPGDSTTGTITVTNNSGTTQKIITESINGTDPDGLGNALTLRIFKTGAFSDFYNDLLEDFLSSAGEVDLSTLANSETTTYTYEVTFGEDVEEYQNATLGFDICIGFFDEAGRVCGNTVIGDDDGDDVTPDSGGGGITVLGSGGGGGNGPPGLVITEEGNEVVTFHSATITWKTNFYATSQVIYREEGDSYLLNLSAPNYGYPYAFPSPEDTNKVLDHSVTITGLDLGKNYYYRVVSHASPATISFEHSFKTLTLEEALNSVSGINNLLVIKDDKGVEKLVLKGDEESGGDIIIGDYDKLKSESDLLNSMTIPGASSTSNVLATSSTSTDFVTENGLSKLQNTATAIFGMSWLGDIPNWLLFLLLLLIIFLVWRLARRK
ncbi:fibronectin type III domain-containing protein [Candidatus Parcubacteria bacterium]|nr:fibronectin type III domain-containing protein [Candidatus Parcubacteria bacterium]